MIYFKKLEAMARCPAIQKEGDAGFDLYSLESARVTGVPTLFRTGVAVAIPEGFVGLVCSRSGLAYKQGVVVSNAPGIIDSNYRGELLVVLHNIDRDAIAFLPANSRIAQLVVVPISTVSTEVVILDTTNRGAGGFGSSGF